MESLNPSHFFYKSYTAVRAEVVCAICKGTVISEPSSETTGPRYLKLLTVTRFCPFT